MFHRHTKAGTICRPVSGGMIPAVLLFHYFLVIVRFVRQWPQQRQLRRIDKITPITINLDRKAGQPVRLSLHLVPKLQ